MRLKNILVGIDFLNDIEEIVRKTEQIVQVEEARIWLLHVANPDPDFVSYEAGPQPERDRRADELKKKKKRMGELTEKLQAGGVKAEALFIKGPTAKTLLDKAGKLHADMIILGNRNHGFFYELFIGSTSLEVLGKSKLPVLLVPVQNKDK